MKSTVENRYREIKSKLHRVRQREKRYQCLKGFHKLAAIVLILAIGLVFAEAQFQFSTQIRTTLLLVFGLGTLFLFTIWVILPLVSLFFYQNTPTDVAVAIKVGSHFTDIKDRLADSLQVYHASKGDGFGTSIELAEAAIEEAAGAMAPLNLGPVVDKSNFKQWARRCLALLLLGFAAFLVFPNSLRESTNRLIHPRTLYARPAPFEMSLEPGSVRAIQGDDVEIRVSVKGDAPDHVSLYLEEGGATEEHILSPPFLKSISHIKRSVTYYAQADKVRTPEHHIEVVQRPMVRMLQVRLVPPAYANTDVILFEPNIGDVDALMGSRVELNVTSNKLLDSARLKFENGKQQPMSVKDRKAGSTFIVQQDDAYQVELTDSLGLVNSDPITYSVRMQPDLNPVARIVFPGENIDLDDEMTLPLALEGEDDYGLSRGRIVYSIHHGGIEDSSVDAAQSFDIELPTNSRRVLVEFTWNMESLNLIPEDVVAYHWEIFDTDAVSGPKSAKSRTYTARFPSMAEIFQEVEAEQNAQTESLTDIYRESQDLRQELERITEAMKTGKEMEWEERKSLEQMTGDQKRMAEEVEDLRQRLDEMIDRLERNDLLSMETLEKYEELQKLYEEVATPELMEAMRKLQETVEQANQEALKKAAEQFQMNQESFLKSIERTLALLKRLQVEQKTDELVKRTQEMLEQQTQLNQEMAKRGDESMSDLAEQENKLQQESESIMQEMEGLHHRMQELTGMPIDQLEAIMDLADRNQLSEKLSEAAQSMQSGDKSQAMEKGSQSQQTMMSMTEMLKEMQKSMQTNQKEKIADALNRASFRLLQLSKGQEALKSGSESGKTGGNEAAQKQMSLLQGLNQVADSLVDLSKVTFFVSPAMGKGMGEAQAQMEQALRQMQQSTSQKAGQSQGNAMGALNKTVLAVQDALEQMASSQSSSGMEQFMAQMEQMAMQQMGINQQTMDMLGKGRMTMAEQAAMSRLAAEQSAMRKAMEDLMGEYGERSEITGRFDRMVEEMKQVVKDLENQNVSRETIERQERILSRMLDAQHSVRRREYSRKRQAKSGRRIARPSPGPIPQLPGDWRDRLRRDILRLSEEGYTKEYQELIRKYFEALVREQ